MELEVKPGALIKSSIKDNSSQQECQTINFYRTPPFGLLTLEQCEDLFRQRLEALHIMEKTKDLSLNNFSLIGNQLREIRSHVYKANCIIVRANDNQQRKLDHFSHMLARMYCMQSETTWNWFRTCERRLLYYRLRDQAALLSGSRLDAILRSFNFNFDRITGTELSKLYQERLVGWSNNSGEKDIPDLFKVDFVHALSYVARRSVLLRGGYAYLTRFEIISVICDIYDNHLREELKFARQHLDTQQMQTQQLLEALSIVYADFVERVEEEKRLSKRRQDGETNNPFQIDLNNLDELVKKHYPPCMRYMQEALSEDHHLKHQARLYYGAFLKSGGVDMESAIEFWRKEFTKKIPNERFERDYKYNIRHLYGREGHKKALTCFSCDKIIKDNPPGPSEKHGCPFRHFDETHLRGLLAKHDVNYIDIESIVQQTKDKQYREACSTYFKSLKGEALTEPVKSPIQFYYESLRFQNRPLPPPPQPIEENKSENEESKQEVGEKRLENEEEWNDDL